MVIERLIVGSLQTNCYLLGCKDTKKIVIIDPGSEGSKIISKIKELNLIPQFILLTHGHEDHIGAVNKLKKLYQIPIYIHKNDNEMLLHNNITTDTFLKDKDIIELGNLKLEIIHLPGHTAGSIGVKCQDIVFSGDTLFKNGIGRTDLPGGSYIDIMNSIKNKLLILPNSIIIFPGHGEKTTIEMEKKYNTLLK